MIFVARSPCPASLDLSDPASAASRELAAGRAHWDATGTPPDGNSFKAYAGADVRAALTILFQGKCAYCESPVSGSSQTDIEHYRPKGGVKECETHPGYWWLAMDWTNLVLSCMHCNQERRQLILDAGLSEEEIRKALEKNDLRTTGKKNAFPTKGDIWMTMQGAGAEEPLLIDPTETDPEPLFEWEFHSSLTTVKPNGEEPRARATIEVLGLNRRHLTEARVQRLNDLLEVDRKITTWLGRMENAATDAEAALARDVVNDLIGIIAAFGDAGKPYSALARAFLAHVQVKVGGMI
jgi:uncharacterized protein (TIGR02646 family)